MKLSAAKINSDALEKGAWVTDIPEMGTLRLKVRGINNSDWRELDRKLTALIPREKRLRGQIDQKEQDNIFNECLVQTALLDWDGFEDDDDKPIPYSKELAREICFNPEYMRYRMAVVWAASIVVDEKKADQEDIIKN